MGTGSAITFISGIIIFTSYWISDMIHGGVFGSKKIMLPDGKPIPQVRNYGYFYGYSKDHEHKFTFRPIIFYKGYDTNKN